MAGPTTSAPKGRGEGSGQEEAKDRDGNEEEDVSGPRTVTTTTTTTKRPRRRGAGGDGAGQQQQQPKPPPPPPPPPGQHRDPRASASATDSSSLTRRRRRSGGAIQEKVDTIMDTRTTGEIIVEEPSPLELMLSDVRRNLLGNDGASSTSSTSTSPSFLRIVDGTAPVLKDLVRATIEHGGGRADDDYDDDVHHEGEGGASSAPESAAATAAATAFATEDPKPMVVDEPTRNGIERNTDDDDESVAETATKDGYRLVLATHCLQRMLREVKTVVPTTTTPQEASATTATQAATAAPAASKKKKGKKKGRHRAAADADVAAMEEVAELDDADDDDDDSKRFTAPMGANTRRHDEDEEVEDRVRLGHVLTTMALGVATFVSQHKTQDHATDAKDKPSGGTNEPGGVAAADATTTPNSAAPSSWLTLRWNDTATRTIGARAVLASAAAALRGMQLLMTIDDDDDCATEAKSHEREGATTRPLDELRTMSWAAGTLALEALVEWDPNPLPNARRTTNIGGNKSGTNEGRKDGSLSDAQDDDNDDDEAAAWDVARRELVAWIRDALTPMDATPGPSVSRAASDQGFPFVAKLPTAITSLDWSREMDLWTALGGPTAGEVPGAAQEPAPVPSNDALPASKATKAKKKAPPPTMTSSKKRRTGGASVDGPAGLSMASDSVTTVPASVQVSDVLQSLVAMYDANRWSMDGRIAPRKWVSVALQWHLSGTEILLRACLHLLEHGSQDSDDTAATSDSAERAGAHIDARRAAALPPGPLKAVLARRLCRVLREMATLSGAKSPAYASGALEAFVGLLGPVATTTQPDPTVGASTSGSSTKRKSKKNKGDADGAIDLRSLATAVAYQLVTGAASVSGSPLLLSLTQVVKDLARCVPGATDADTSRIESAAAAFAFQADFKSDVRFCTFCVQKLNKSLERHGNDTAQERLLARPLPRPTHLAPTPSKKGRSGSTGAFGGVFDDGADNLTVFLRAMRPECYGRLVARLVELVESCYNRGISGIDRGQSREPRRKKKRASLHPTSRTTIDAAQMSLATEVLRVLGACLLVDRQDPLSSSVSASPQRKSSYRDCLRQPITADHVSRLISCGRGVREFLRMARPDSSQDENLSSLSEFTRHEKLLWDSYADVCDLIGRGHATHKSITKKPGLGGTRKAVYELIVQQAMQNGRPGTFPLWVCFPHRRLVACSLQGESIEDAAADRYFVDGVISGVSSALSDPLKLVEPSPIEPLLVSLEEEVPLSLSFARIFCLSILRLDATGRVSAISSLIEAAHSGFASLDREGPATLWESQAVARFLGRVVSTCTSLVLCETSSSSLLGQLRTMVDSSIPMYLASASWKRAELSFCSIFDDTTYSELEEPDFRDCSLEKDKIVLLQSLLLQAFELGFKCASIDNGYLLFASWAATGKSDLWRADTATSIPPFVSLPKELSSLALELRNDVCYVARLHHLYCRGAYDSNFLRAVDRKLFGHGLMAKKTLAEKISQALKIMITKAESVCSDLCERYGEGQCSPPEACCLLEFLPYYVTYAISCHTKSRRNFFDCIRSSMKENRSRKRSRSCSSYSDNCSEDDSVDSQDLLIDAADRLQEVCASIGTVPAHPDWLDADCEFSDCVKPVEAGPAALRCLEVLVRIASLGLQNMARHEQVDVAPTDSQVASSLARIRLLHDSVLETDSVAVTTPHLALLTGVRGSLIDGSELAGNVDKRIQIRRRWITESSQRCRGSLQESLRKDYINSFDDSVLRAAHEWEVLLAGPLSTCALRSPVCSSDVCESRWMFVAAAAIGAMAPTSALLYFCYSSTPRMRHPLSIIDSCVETSESSHLSAEFNSFKPLPESSKQVIQKTLAIVSQSFDVVGDQVPEAIASNLVDLDSFHLLQDVAAGRLALSVLNDLVARFNGPDSTAHAFPPLVNLISSVLEHGAHRASKSNNVDLQIAIGVNDRSFKSISGDTPLREVLDAYARPGLLPASLEISVEAMVACIWPDSAVADSDSRHRIMRVLLSLTASNGCFGPSDSVRAVQSHLTGVLNMASDSRMRLLIEQDVCGAHGIRSVGDTPSAVPALLANALTTTGPVSFTRTKLVYDTMERSYETWMPHVQSQAIVLNLFLLFASHCRELHNLGERLVNDLNNSSASFRGVVDLAGFIQGLRPRQFKEDGNQKNAGLQSAPPTSRMCSHALQSGFVNQHWYHCATCNLTGDKGCCTLCAVVCHAGHNVSYSRFSAFFCDCGAESGMQRHGRSLACRCLTEVPRDVVDSAMAAGRGAIRGSTGSLKCDSAMNLLSSSHRCGQIARECFPVAAEESLRLLIERGQQESWFPTILRSTQVEGLMYASSSSPPVCTYESSRSGLRGRAPAVTVVTGGTCGALACSASFRAGSFTVKISEESSVDSLKRALISTSGTFRKALATTSRGITVVAETNSLLVCTLLPATNGHNAYTRNHLQRSSASIVGSKAVDFNVVGVQLCDAMEDRLVVWGTHDAAVALLNESRTNVDRFLNLDAGLGTIESSQGVILDCRWLPSSFTCFFVCSTRSLTLFMIASNGDVVRVSSLIDGAESAIRGFVVSETSCTEWKCYLLTEDGRLRAFELKNRAGSFQPDKWSLDQAHSIQLPVLSTVDATPALALSLGEGIDLSILQQSRLLLYQAVGDRVLALPLDKSGSVAPGFTLLPKNPVAGVSGPFRHFTELGLVTIDSVVYFRVFCVGRRDSNESAFLLIDFCHSSTRITELFPASASRGAGSAPIVEGVAAFSCPIASERYTPLEERCFVAVLLSNGSLLSFGEEFGTPTVNVRSAFMSPETPSSCGTYVPPESSETPLFAFEGLDNVMESEDVLIESSELGSSTELRKRLLRDNNECLTASGFDGYNLFVRVKPRFCPRGSRALVAFRFLVGTSTAASIPRTITVQGRDVRLLPDVQKWYSVCLSKQEVAQAFRNGFVAIRLSEAFGSCTYSVLDAMECYACDFSMVSNWLPCTAHTLVAGTANADTNTACTSRFSTGPPQELKLGALAVISTVLAPLQELDATRVNLLHRLVSDSVPVYSTRVSNSVDAILAALGWGEDVRSSFRDQAILDGCSSSVLHSKSMLTPQLIHSNWHSLRSSLRCCAVAASKVVAARPMEYRSYFGQGPTPGEMFSNALTEWLRSSDESLGMIPDIVELCLLEVAAGAKTSFDTIELILRSEHVVACALACASIARFCQVYQSQQKPESDPFPRQMVVSYRCDGCDLCPIVDSRFTYEARGVDLCVTCYNAADRYASLKSYSSNSPVLLGGKPVGELKCHEMKRMKSVATKGETLQRQQLFDEFVDHLLTTMLRLVPDIGMCNTSLLSLLLALCHQSSGNEKVSRLSATLVSGLAQVMSAGEPDNESACSLIHALSRLVVWDEGAALCFVGSDRGLEVQNRSDADNPRCQSHGLRSICREATHKTNAGRRFFCCSKDAKSQCNFFRWEDDPIDSKAHYNEAVAEIIWAEMQPVLDDLSKWITPACRTDGRLGLQGSSEPSELDTIAGIYCCRHRLRDVLPRDFLSILAPRFRLRSESSSGDATIELLCLLALVASPKGDAVTTWSPVLCQMISSRDNPLPEATSSAAKRALLLMCGSRSRYIAVRAQFSFALNRDRLALEAGGLLLSAFAVKERARQSSADWRNGSSNGDISKLRAGDLLGTEDLISEDITTSSRLEDARRILMELALIAKKRPDHWAAFCGLHSLPNSPFISLPASRQQVLKIPPAVFLFAVSCLCRGEAQLRAFQLIDLSLPSSLNGGDEPKDNSTELSSSADVDRDSSRILELTPQQAVAFVVRFGCHGGSPEIRRAVCSIAGKLYLHRDSQANGDLFESLVAVALSQVCTAGKICLELLRLLQYLVNAPSSDRIGLAAASSQILAAWRLQMRAIPNHRPEGTQRYELSQCRHCMHAVMVRRSEKRVTPLTPLGATTEETPAEGTSPAGTASARRGLVYSKAWLPEQFTVFSRGRLEGWRDATCSDEFNMFSSLKYRLVLSEIHFEVSDPRGRFVKTISFFYSPRPVADVGELKSADYQAIWQPCGVLTLSKGENRGCCKLPRPVVASNLRIEYTSFYERPGSGPKPPDGSFVIHCPRCTRIVTNAHGVCGNCGEVCFQCRKCRHINYDRLDAYLCVECGYCSSGTFGYELTAAIASNALAIRNDLDYERSCRMLSIATRLHEDLQAELRDRLDEVAGESGGRSTQARSGLPHPVSRAFAGLLPLTPGEVEEAAPPALSLSKLGRPGSVVKAVARSDQSATSGALPPIMSRAHSLLRLTREWRETTARGRSSNGPDGGAVVFHHLGGGDSINFDRGHPMMMDESESNELFGLLEGAAAAAAAASSGRGSGNDPLSRLLATMQHRRERRTAMEGGGGVATLSSRVANAGLSSPVTGTPAGGSAPAGGKGSLDLCDRLYALMREAEREACYLRLRVSAWRRLEAGNLLLDGSLEPHSSDPARVCSSCALPVALQLLRLWLDMFKLKPKDVHVTADVVQLLCRDDSVSVSGSQVHSASLKELAEVKRRALIEIAVRGTSSASGLVLDALRLRLLANECTRSSEILGSIVEAGGPREYYDLAVEILEITAD